MNNKKTIISLVAVVAVAAGVVGISAMNKKESIPVTPDTTIPVADTATSSTLPAKSTKQTATVYKDGTYTATGSYRSPGGTDELGVTATIKNDVLVSVVATPMAHDRTSEKYQAMFMTGYQAVVVGKKVDAVHIDTVSGSSLTGIGFNDAFSKIKAQAKA